MKIKEAMALMHPLHHSVHYKYVAEAESYEEYSISVIAAGHKPIKKRTFVLYKRQLKKGLKSASMGL